MSQKRILITSALPYANGPLHFGHIAGAYLPADCYARFERLRGNEVLYVCGSDAYGVAITLSAEMAGRSPKEHVEYNHTLIQRLFKQMKIEFDHYSCTTNSYHAPLVQKFFSELQKGNFTEEKETVQLYDQKAQRFMADRYVVGTCPKCGYDQARGDECGKCGASFEATDLKNPCSKLTGEPLTTKSTRHWFLRFDLFKNKLHAFLETKAWKANVLQFAKQYADDLRPRAITRDLKWGVPVNVDGAEEKVFYVWFDAPIGYISATQEWAEKQGDSSAWEKFWLDQETLYVQFLGKDNIPFHALFFPAMLMGQSLPYKCVDDLVANEFLTLEGRQFSKSEGWVIDLEDFFKTFTADQIRFALAANAPETSDSAFTWQDFQMRCNNELVGKLGNLVNRVLVFLHGKAEGKIPKKGSFSAIDSAFYEKMQSLIQQCESAYSSYHLRKVTRLIMELAQEGNAYFDHKAPWKSLKAGQLDEMYTTLYLCLECLKLLALMITPLMPETAQRLQELLQIESRQMYWNEWIAYQLEEGRTLPKPEVLFQKVEDEIIKQKEQALKQQSNSSQKLNLAPLKPEISFDTFSQMDLRVGQVTKVESVPKSKKLLKLEVDLGFEKRVIVSGISQFFTPEQMLNRRVIVVANLKPAKLMGIESQGMILAASHEQMLDLVSLKQDLPLGSEVS